MPQNERVPLTRGEIEANRKRITFLFDANLIQSAEQKRVNEVKDSLAEFARLNGITLINLLADEEAALREIISRALRAEELAIFEQELLLWSNNLKLAVAGQGEHIAMHAARSSGMAADLINLGGVPAGKWSTDLDIRQCLGKDLTHPNTISRAGIYILPPVSLTERIGYKFSMMKDGQPNDGEIYVKGEKDGLKYKVPQDKKVKTIAWDQLPNRMKHDFNSIDEIKNFLPDILMITADRGDTVSVPFHAMVNEVVDTLYAKNVKGKVAVRIPVNCGDQHWRLAKINIENKKMTSALLWDSLQPGNEDNVKETPAFQNFSKIVQAYDVEPELKLAGVQHNAHSCAGFSIQEGYKDVGINNEITQAKNNADKLRLAEVKQIAMNHENINQDVITHLIIHENGAIDFGGKVKLKDIASLNSNTQKSVEAFLEKFADKTQNEMITKADRDWQITFDSVFSEHLQELYEQNPHHTVKEETALVKEARRRAMLEIGFFPAAEKNNKHIEKLDVSNSHNLKK